MEVIQSLFLGTPLWLWGAFLALVLALLTLDLGLFGRKSGSDGREIGVSQSLWLSAFYISVGLAFALVVWWQIGAGAALAYLTAFTVEKTLALDNIFVIALIFAALSIPRAYQHRVLFWGILGVIVLRGLMIGLGATLVARYDWVLYLFVAFLVITGIKMLVMKEKEHDITQNPVLEFLRRHLRLTEGLHGQAFTHRGPHPVTGKTVLWLTPLALALIMVELADIVFAVDSVPAVFAITADPFIVYTSNIFAILGLRALYFALAAVLHRFAYLKQALAVLLVVIGSKVFVADLLGWEKFPPALSLGLTVVILGAGIGWSLWKTKGAGAPLAAGQ